MLNTWHMGSSPLTRGKHLSAMFDRSAGGLIPAHAGKTSAIRSPRSTQRAHPRSRGENEVAGSSPVGGAGSSPLTRGKHYRGCCRCVGAGLIPAHAGKTRTWGTRHLRSRAHPRSRGENLQRENCGRSHQGSSPLTRGKPDAMPARLRIAGLIPAHAGKTRCHARTPAHRWAHPRSRGENPCH